MASEVSLKNISVAFKKYEGQSTQLKEAVVRFLKPPSWQKEHPPKSNTFWGLRNIDLHLKEGDRLGIMGHNGAGKSTLLKVISRIYRPKEGKLSVQGRIAPLIEIGAGFHPELSGRENIFLNGAILGIPKKLLQERLESIVEFSDLKDAIDMPVKYYSTGMHLRLAFTIATEIPPDILILDELFAGGDAEFVERADIRLREHIHQSKILILVTHNLEYIDEFCNRALILDHGRILKQGAPKEMTQHYLTMCHERALH